MSDMTFVWCGRIYSALSVGNPPVRIASVIQLFWESSDIEIDTLKTQNITEKYQTKSISIGLQNPISV